MSKPSEATVENVTAFWRTLESRSLCKPAANAPMASTSGTSWPRAARVGVYAHPGDARLVSDYGQLCAYHCRVRERLSALAVLVASGMGQQPRGEQVSTTSWTIRETYGGVLCRPHIGTCGIPAARVIATTCRCGHTGTTGECEDHVEANEAEDRFCHECNAVGHRCPVGIRVLSPG